MTDDVSTRLAEIRERVEAATEGPWRAEDDPDALMYDVTISDRVPLNEDFRGAIATLSQTNQIPKTEQLDNAEFLAAARSDVPYLLSLVEEVGEALAAIPDPFMDTVLQSVEKHAGYEAARELAQVRDAALKAEYDAALRDAAQEGAE